MYLVFKGIPWKDFIDKLLHANYFFVIISGLTGIVAFYFRGLRWQLMIEPLGYKPKSSDMLKAVAVGYLANMVFPRMGEVVRCGALNRTNKIPVNESFGTVITERLIDFIALILILLFVIIFKINFFGKFFQDKVFQPLSDKFIEYSFVLIVIGLCVLICLLVSIMFFKKYKENKIVNWTKSKIKGLKNGLISILKIEKKWQFLFYTFIIWFFYFLMAYVVFFAIPETSHLKPIDAVFVLVAGSFGMVAPVQNGFGAYHWIVSLALMMYGLSKETGLLFATLLHEMQVVMILIVGPIASYFVYFNKMNKKETILNEQVRTNTK